MTYQFCYTLNSTKTCTTLTSLTINSKNGANEKNFTTIPAPSFPENTTPLIFILSAAEKDTNGNIIAKGNYSYGKEGYNNCGGALSFFPDIPLNIGIELDDENQSPFILCRTSNY